MACSACPRSTRTTPRGRSARRYGQFKLAEDAAAGRALIDRARATFEEIGATGGVTETEAALGRS